MRSPRAHPRVRGDDLGMPGEREVAAGSPPRARGRRRQGPVRRGCHGLTPACAGTTMWSLPVRPLSWAHPRVRGDDKMASCAESGATGSPPRARGRPGRVDQLRPGQGLTPACAGTTSPSSWRRRRWRAHPRVRGDDDTADEMIEDLDGSPPRARGRREPPHRVVGRERLTPACAGTTRRRLGLVVACGAHPRVRGDDTWEGDS